MKIGRKLSKGHTQFYNEELWKKYVKMSRFEK